MDAILHMPGPEFLVLYLLVFLSCMGGRLLLQSDFTDWIFFLGFEILGFLKLMSAAARGKPNVEGLIIMMIFGGLILLAKQMKGGSLGGGSCSSGCSSGTCGGGCGGGGCGGCGG